MADELCTMKFSARCFSEGILTPEAARLRKPFKLPPPSPKRTTNTALILSFFAYIYGHHNPLPSPLQPAISQPLHQSKDQPNPSPSPSASPNATSKEYETKYAHYSTQLQSLT